MGKRSRERREGETGPAQGGGGGGVAWLPVVLAAGALVMAFVAWTDARKVKDDVGRRLSEVDQRVTGLQTQVANASKAKPPQQQGPDPNRAYTVKTEGSPYKGNATAPIVIAEFSDYQ
jgi:protein-disulfide isomerase